MFEIVRRFLRDQQDRQYFAEMGSRLTSDLGAAASGLASAPADTRQRMEKMAAAFGLSPDAIDQDRWRALDIANACGHCEDRAACRRWLAGSDDTVAPEDFCPNAQVYAEMAAARGAEGVAQQAHARRKKGSGSYI